MMNLNWILAYLDEEADQQLLEDIFYTYSKQMAEYAGTILQNKDDVEDVVGTVFERIAARNFDVVRSIQNETDLRNYLLKATKNTCLNVLRKKQRVCVSLDDLSEHCRITKEELSDDGFIDEVCRRMEYEEVLQALRLLPEKYSDALYYHFVLDVTVADAAKLMFQSVSATKQQLVRGKKMLLSLLDKKGDESFGDHKE